MVQMIVMIGLLLAAAALVVTRVQIGRRRRLGARVIAEPMEYRPIEITRYWVASAEELNSYTKHDERRLKPRRGGAPTPIRYLEGGNRTMQEAYVLDRNDRGLRLAVLHDIPTNRVIRIKADNAPPNTPWVEVVVCWCSGVKGGFDIGCKYKESVPANVRLMFG